MKQHPKVSIVTACYNSEKYLEKCIMSIMSQTYDNVEHIIIDGGSNDKTLDIIKKYEKKYNMRWISEKDNGMYDAISKGFAMADGDIYAWLNSDDMYMPWACEIVARIMQETDTHWCTGIPCHYNERGVAYNIPRVTPVFQRRFIRKGYMDGRVATFLEQESMFWDRNLWEKCSGVLSNYKMAGDYHLWKKFAEYEKLVTIDSVISGFRIHTGQKSEDRGKYYSEIAQLNLMKKIMKRLHVIPVLLLLDSLVSFDLRLRSGQYLK